MDTQIITCKETSETNSNITFVTSSTPTHNLLLRIGIPAHLYGYGFIIYALELCLLDPSVLHHVTKGLYIDIAKKFQTSPYRVEHAIRHAIKVACQRGNIDFINQIFPYRVLSLISYVL